MCVDLWACRQKKISIGLTPLFVGTHTLTHRLHSWWQQCVNRYTDTHLAGQKDTQPNFVLRFSLYRLYLLHNSPNSPVLRSSMRKSKIIIGRHVRCTIFRLSDLFRNIQKRCDCRFCMVCLTCLANVDGICFTPNRKTSMENFSLFRLYAELAITMTRL